jgi:hypothetical protein
MFAGWLRGGIMTREEFFARPNYWYYLGGQPVPDEWIAQAWEEIPEFRENITYGISREASKIGELEECESELEYLDGILPLHRMIEIYERVKACAPNREPEFRPTFQRVFGDRMSAFPAPLPQPAGEPDHPYGVPTTGPDEPIPF